MEKYVAKFFFYQIRDVGFPDEALSRALDTSSEIKKKRRNNFW